MKFSIEDNRVRNEATVQFYVHTDTCKARFIVINNVINVIETIMIFEI